MATLEISDKLDAALQQAADRLGCTKADLFHDAITAHLEQNISHAINLTEVQIKRMRESCAQLERGEGVPGEVVMAKFDSFIAQRQGR